MVIPSSQRVGGSWGGKDYNREVKRRKTTEEERIKIERGGVGGRNGRRKKEERGKRKKINSFLYPLGKKSELNREEKFKSQHSTVN